MASGKTSPPFIKKQFSIDSVSLTGSGTTRDKYLTASDFDYAVPDGYVPFGISSYWSGGAMDNIFDIDLNAVDTDTFLRISNRSGSNETTNIVVEVVFVRKDFNGIFPAET